MNARENQINIAIAEFCGWTKIESLSPYGGHTHGINPNQPESMWPWQTSPIPNYCGDLNAMNQAEKRLFDYQWDDYIDWLATGLGVRVDDTMEIMHASALQRAEALVKAIGKWEERYECN